MPDDLRTADVIDDLIAAVMDNTHGREGVLDRKGAEKDLREYVADPVRRLAILNLIGDVDTVWRCQCGATATFPDTPLGVHHVAGWGGSTGAPICRHKAKPMSVVRPRGEATDA